MLICAFGTPGELTLAGINLLKALMQERFGAYHWIAASTADDLAEAWTGRQQGHTLLFADIPDVRVTRLLVEFGRSFRAVFGAACRYRSLAGNATSDYRFGSTAPCQPKSRDAA